MDIIADNKKFFFCMYLKVNKRKCDQFTDFCKDFSILLNNINDHTLLSLVILMLNAQNGIPWTKIMQLEKLCRLVQQL